MTKFKDLVKLFNELRKSHSVEEIMEMPVITEKDKKGHIGFAVITEEIGRENNK